MNALLLTALLLAAPAAPATSAATSATAASPDPADPSGEFRGASWGMSEAEVSKRFGGAIRPMQPRINLADGAVVALEIPGLDLAGQPVDARFVFAGGKLAIVSLRSPQQGYVAEDTYDKLAKHLETRFGAPGEAMDEEMVAKLRQVTWRLPKGVAELKYAQGVLVLQYHPPEQAAPAAPAK